MRIQQANDSESEIQEAIFCGLWRVRRRHGEQLLEDKLEAGCAPLALGRRQRKTSCRQIRCYRRPLMA